MDYYYAFIREAGCSDLPSWRQFLFLDRSIDCVWEGDLHAPRALSPISATLETTFEDAVRTARDFQAAMEDPEANCGAFEIGVVRYSSSAQYPHDLYLSSCETGKVVYLAGRNYIAHLPFVEDVLYFETLDEALACVKGWEQAMLRWPEPTALETVVHYWGTQNETYCPYVLNRFGNHTLWDFPGVAEKFQARLTELRELEQSRSR